jgi:hypothetical protein
MLSSRYFWDAGEAWCLNVMLLLDVMSSKRRQRNGRRACLSLGTKPSSRTYKRQQ